MTYFPFDRTGLDTLNEQDKEEALKAASTAEEVARFYQELAKTIVNGGDIKTVQNPRIKTDEVAITLEATAIVRSMAQDQGSTAARAAVKLFLGTQMDFYRLHPQFLEAFNLNGNPSKAESFFKILQYMHYKMDSTYPAVDEYFEDAYRRMEKWVTSSAHKDTPEPMPRPKP